MEFQLKSAEEIAAMSSEQQNEYFTAKQQHDQKRLADLEEKAASIDDLKQLRAEMAKDQNDRIEAVMDILKQQGVAIAKQNLKPDPKPGQADIVKNMLLNGMQGEAKNLEILQKMKQGGIGAKHLNVNLGMLNHLSLATKVPGDMTVSGNVTGGVEIPQGLVLPGYNPIAQRQTSLLNIVQRGPIATDLVRWVYLLNEDGTAGSTDEGTAKNQIDFDWTEGEERVRKHSAYIKASTEMLADIAFMDRAVRTQLFEKLIQSVESQVYSGTGAGTPAQLRGIRTVATAFAAGGFANAVDNANEVDVLTVAMNQIMLANQSSPTHILVNPSTIASLLMTKVSASDRRYVSRLVAIGSSLTLDGVPIIPTNLVTADTYLVGDFRKAYVLEREAPSVQIGLDSDDFTKNFRTMLIEWRGVSYVMNNDRTAFVAGTFSTDAAALETP